MQEMHRKMAKPLQCHLHDSHTTHFVFFSCITFHPIHSSSSMITVCISLFSHVSQSQCRANHLCKKYSNFMKVTTCKSPLGLPFDGAKKYSPLLHFILTG